MRKVTAKGNPEYTKLTMRKKTTGATLTPANIRIRTRSGREFFEEVMAAKGHMDDPMKREDLNAKFDSICKDALTDEQRERIRSAWWDVARSTDIGEPIQTLTGFRQL